jgi:hypothetical protein
METVASFALLIAVVGVLVGSWAWSLRRHARQGGTFDWAKPRVARLELPCSAERTRELIYAGLLDALGTRTPRRKKHRDDFKIRSHLDGAFGPGSAIFRFELRSLGEERTELTISLPTLSFGSEGGPPDPDEAPARVQQVDRLAQWLAEHGEGELVESRWGRRRTESSRHQRPRARGS